jgi:hypothetical protein
MRHLSWHNLEREDEGMDDAFGVYSAAMKGTLGPGWWSSWPLATRHSVGDICSVTGGQLLSAGSLDALGVHSSTAVSPYADNLTYDSSGSVAVTFKASGRTGPLFQALSQAELGAHVAFSRDRSVFAVFTGLRQTAMTEPRLLARHLTELYFRQEWEPDWVAVTHLLSAEAGTVLIAASATAEAELRVTADAGAGAVKMADLAGKVGLARSRNIGLQWLGGNESTPFCRVVALRKSWLGRVNADFAPRQQARGLAPADIPVRLMHQAEDRPDEVIAEVGADDDAWAGDTPAARS